MGEKEFLSSLGIDDDGVYSNNCYIITFNNSNKFGAYYSLLSKCKDIDEDEDTSQVTLDSSSIQFIGDEFTITLLANLETDEYKLICRKEN